MNTRIKARRALGNTRFPLAELNCYSGREQQIEFEDWQYVDPIDPTNHEQSLPDRNWTLSYFSDIRLLIQSTGGS